MAKQPNIHSKVRKAKTGANEVHEGFLFMEPIPSPELMKQYAEVDPTFPDRILKMAEAESAHRQSEEKKLNKCRRAEIRSDGFGRLSALFLAFFALGGVWLFNVFIV